MNSLLRIGVFIGILFITCLIGGIALALTDLFIGVGNDFLTKKELNEHGPIILGFVSMFLAFLLTGPITARLKARDGKKPK
jgi:hypothetical protein